VKYTTTATPDLSGAVDGADYQQIDSGFGNNLTGWQNGDFNYDGVVDGSDYALIDTPSTRSPHQRLRRSRSSRVQTSVIAGPTSTTAVPETAFLGLFGCCVVPSAPASFARELRDPNRHLSHGDEYISQSNP